MKQKTLKGYVNHKLTRYLEVNYDKSFRKKYLAEKAKNDVRLLELVSTYFALQEDQFALDLSKERFGHTTFEDILNKNNKYILEYKDYLDSHSEVKEMYRKLIKEYAEANGITMYKLSKLAKTNQSNVSKFFNSNDNNALSEKKLKFLIRVTRRYDMLSNKKYNS